MNDKCFIDTNILVYAFDQNDSTRMKKASTFLKEIKQSSLPIISVQILGEFFNVTTKKCGLAKEVALSICEQFSLMYPICNITNENVLHAMKLSAITQFSYWDSLILAVAIDSGCSTVYSEDLNNGQIIESIKIINPFL